MEHLKEPKNVDFVIDSDPLTDETRREITAYIQAYKAKAAKKKVGMAPDTKSIKTSRF